MKEQIVKQTFLTFLTALLMTATVSGLVACQSGLVGPSKGSFEGSSVTGGDPQAAHKDPSADPKNQSWAMQMRNLGADLTDLLPLAFNADAFRDNANEALIQQKLRNLDENAKAIQHSPMQTIVDPSVNFISYDFHDQVKRVRESFAEGKKDYARYELISTSHFCIECHTRSAVGPAFGAEKFKEGMLKLSPLDRADYLTATRHFDQALELYIEYFKENQTKKINALQSEKAALSALVITVRYQNDAGKAASLVEAVQKSSHAPYYLKLAAGAWAADIQEWIKENNAHSSHNRKKSPGSTGGKFDIKAPKTWLEKSQTRRFEKGVLGGEVLALRSIAALNSALPSLQGKETRAEAFYLLGQSYLSSVFSEHSNLGEKYLETCIRTFPKTPWSKKCYQKYEEVVYSNYTGSAGTFMPADEEIRLQELFKLVE